MHKVMGCKDFSLSSASKSKCLLSTCQPLTTRIQDQLPLFLEPSKSYQAQPMQFYRIRSRAPAYITQSGVKGGKFN